jgi:hypothetical protein
MKIKVSELQVGMVVKFLLGEGKILAFKESTYQKNGKELRMALIDFIQLDPDLPNFLNRSTDVGCLGKMDRSRSIVLNSKYHH